MWVIVIAAIVAAGVWFFKFKKKKREERIATFMKFAADNNVNIDYRYHTVLGIDAATKTLILSSDQKNYQAYPISNIVSMVKYDSGGGGGVAAWQIKFITRSLEHPQVFVPFLNNVERNLWYDRINALWSGGK